MCSTVYRYSHGSSHLLMCIGAGGGDPIGQMCQCRFQTRVPKVKGEEGALFPHSRLCVEGWQKDTSLVSTINALVSCILSQAFCDTAPRPFFLFCCWTPWLS